MSGRGARPTQELLRDNMEDLGIDKLGDDPGASELYPPLLNRPSRVGGAAASSAAASNDMFCIRKMEEVARRFHASAYNLQYKDAKVDIARYSDKFRLAAAAGQRTVLECINALGPSKESFFSQELLEGLVGNKIGAISSRAGAGAEAGAGASAGGGDATAGIKRRKRSNSTTARTLEKLSQRERVAGPGGALPVPKPRTGSIDSGAASIEEEDEAEDDDYGVDHYGSGDDGGDDGDDDEPSFY